jgi:CRP-like cAMP-binding protein
MRTFITESRQWTPAEVADLLIEGTGIDLTREAAMHIVELLKTQHVAAGTILMEEGMDDNGDMAIVLEGEALVVNAVEGADEALVLSEIGPGAVVGELGILDGKPRSATVTAVTDMDIAVLDRGALAQLIDTCPGVACSLLSAMIVRIGERLRATNARVRELVEENLKLKEQLALA